MADEYWNLENLEIGKVEIMMVNCKGNVDGIKSAKATGNGIY